MTFYFATHENKAADHMGAADSFYSMAEFAKPRIVFDVVLVSCMIGY